MDLRFVIGLLILCGIVLVVLRLVVRRMIVFEYQRGVQYTRGKLVRVLDAGAYWYRPFATTITVVDIRPRVVSIPGQEVLTADGVTLKVSLAARYQVADPHTVIIQAEDYQAALYLELQLALRTIIGQAPIEDLLRLRGEFGAQVHARVEEKVRTLGITLLAVDIKDIMFPGPLKQVFAQVAQAKQEGLAALERARGETATLRHLANAARMVENTPGLMPLRLLQSLGNSTGHTVVLHLSPASTPSQSDNSQTIPPAAPDEVTELA